MDNQAAIPFRRIIFFGRPNLQNSILTGFIQQKTGIPTTMDNTYEWKNHDTVNNTLALIDAEIIPSPKFNTLLNEIHNQESEVNVAFIGVQPSHNPERLIVWPRVAGIFYHNASQQQLCKGIDSLFAGEYWLPRKLIANYLQAHRRRPKEAAPVASTLTKRELQILLLAATGATNTQIAKELNVSMHTVKTHIYNLFRKIGVANRMQAVNWAKEFLEFSIPF